MKITHQYSILFGCLLLLTPHAMVVHSQSGCATHRTLTHIAHFDVNTRPRDIAITPDGKVAIVRGNEQGSRILAFDLIAGTQIPITGGPNATGNHLNIADSVAVTNTRAVIIGSMQSDPILTSRVDILRIDATPAVSLLRTHSFTDLGYSNDVAITPDETMAVVTSAERIRVFDLTDTVPPDVTPLLAEFTVVGSPRWQFNAGGGALWTDIVADSVEIDQNNIAIIQYAYTTEDCGPNRPQPILHVVDLNTLTIQSLGLGPALTDAAEGCAARWPHDVAIAFPLGLAVGSASAVVVDLIGMGVDFLSDGTTPRGSGGGLFQTTGPQVEPLPPFIGWGSTVDSVVINGNATRAVVISHSDFGANPQRLAEAIRIYELSSAGPTLAASLSIPISGGVHDLALSPSGLRAVAKTITAGDVDNYILHLMTPAYYGIAEPAGSNPRGSDNAFVSDSVAITDLPPRAIAIATNSTTQTGHVQIFNTNNGSVISSPSVAFDDSNDRLVDLVAVGNFVIVRASDSLHDLVGYNTCTGQSMGSFDLLGECKKPAVDHLEAKGPRVITASENPSLIGATRGYIDIFRY